MAITFVNYTAQDYGAASSNQTVALPTGWAVGDLLVMFVIQGTTGITVTGPSGWTTIANYAVSGADISTAVFYKVAVSGESTPTFSVSGGDARGGAVLAAYRFVDQVTPFDVTWQSSHGADDAAGSTTREVPSITTVTPGAMLLGFVASDGSAGAVSPQYTPPTNWTERADWRNNTSDHYLATLADYIPASTGAQSGHSFTSTYSDRAMPVVVLALRPLNVNQVTETDTAQPLGRTKSKALGLVTETDTAQIFTVSSGGGGQNVPLNQVTETDTAQAVTRRKSQSLGQPTETDIAQTVVLPQSVVWEWVGGISTAGAVVAAKVTNGTSARLKIATDAALTANVVFGSSATVDANNYVKMSTPTLSAGTTYFYAVEIDGLVDTSLVGQFKTAPSGAASFSFVFGSCNASATTTDAWARALALTPDLCFHVGDLHYEDIGTNTQSLFRSAYDAVFAKADAQEELFRKVPTTYVWSDHDFGGNNSTGGATAKPAAQAVYRQCVPHHTLEVSDGIYHTFTYGRVRFIVTDERSFKSAIGTTDDSNKTMLGTTQKTWFKNLITNSTEKMIVWVGDTPWTDAAAADDEWSAYNTERTELGNHIRDSRKCVVRISGDQHAVAAHNGSGSPSVNPGNIPVLSAAPWIQTASNKGTWTSGPTPTSGTPRQFGYVTITDDGSALTLVYKGYTTTDTVGAQLIVSSVTAASETDTALAITVRKSRAVNLVTETDAAQSVARLKAKALSQTTEADTAQAVTRQKSRIANQVTETNLALTVSIQGAKNVPLNQVLETDLALPITARKTKAVGLTAETDATQPMTVRKSRTLGQPSTTGTSLTITARKLRTVGQVVETDQALPVGGGSAKNIPVGLVSETDVAQTVARLKTRTVGQTTTAESVWSIVRTKTVHLGVTYEVDQANEITQPPERGTAARAERATPSVTIAPRPTPGGTGADVPTPEATQTARSTPTATGA